MINGFWQNLKKPIYGLAPMYDVTDAAFRLIVAKYGKPDVIFTEFISADGLISSEGRKRLMHHLIFDESERPIVAQIFGKNPENFFLATKLLKSLGFDGIDINLGCPDKKIMRQGCCAALFKNPARAREIIQAAREGGSGLPVSVKIRIGDAKIDWRDWLENLIAAQPAAISIHLRTRKEMSKVPAHWEIMPQIMQFVIGKYGAARPLILGNGDVVNLSDAREKIKASGMDGCLLGRAAFGNPWLFSRSRENRLEPAEEQTIKPQQKLNVMAEHAKLYEKLFADIKSFEIMKKHFKAYCTGFAGAKELKKKLMLAKSAAEVKKIVLGSELRLRPEQNS